MEAVNAASASDNFLRRSAFHLSLGRVASRKDVGRGYVNAVTISYELWQRRFQGDPGVIGRESEINNLPMRVVGVLPEIVPPVSRSRCHHATH